MPPREPSLDAYSNPLLRFVAATRPAFLSVTLAACLIGLATVHYSGLPIHPLKAFLAVFFALVAHAGVNVINDYYDALNGTDEANTERQFPFTGGSRFIQNGVLSLKDTARLGYALLAAVIPAGLWLTAHSGPGLILIGLIGLLLGWAYSAPPLKLMCRGLGELAIVGGWLVVVIGSDFVQRDQFSPLPVIAGLPQALLVANILIINQFPDYRADALVGKANLVVRLGLDRAPWLYVAAALLAYGWLLAMVVGGQLPAYALAGLLPVVFSYNAARQLIQHGRQPTELVPALKLTVAAANLHGLLLAAGLALASA